MIYCDYLIKSCLNYVYMSVQIGSNKIKRIKND